jgi:hypothetical protein
VNRASPDSTAADDAGSAVPARLPTPTVLTSATSMTLSSASAIVADEASAVRTVSPEYSLSSAFNAAKLGSPTRRTSTVPVAAVTTAAGPSLGSCWMPPAVTPIFDVTSSAFAGGGSVGLGSAAFAGSAAFTAFASVGLGSSDFLQAASARHPSRAISVVERRMRSPFSAARLATRSCPSIPILGRARNACMTLAHARA